MRSCGNGTIVVAASDPPAATALMRKNSRRDQSFFFTVLSNVRDNWGTISGGMGFQDQWALRQDDGLVVPRCPSSR